MATMLSDREHDVRRRRLMDHSVCAPVARTLDLGSPREGKRRQTSASDAEKLGDIALPGGVQLMTSDATVSAASSWSVGATWL